MIIGILISISDDYIIAARNNLIFDSEKISPTAQIFIVRTSCFNPLAYNKGDINDGKTRLIGS